MLVHWVWLAHRPGLGDWLRWQILQQFGDPESVYYADDYRSVEGLSPEGIESLLDKSLASAEKILEDCLNRRLHILTIQDAAYPERLRNIPDPPLVLYYKGQVPDLEGTAVIGVVGTRRATPYGLTVAKRMGYQIGKCGGVVVSGMARGIDAVAMSGGLTGDAPVVGVLGCGVDIIYPVSNRALFEDVERYGCIFSELPPGTQPTRWTFPRRNRIISGLSCGILVVEAPEKSGALITARLAADQGRDVFVVPGNIDNDACTGSNRLLRDGAIAVGCGWDVLSEYELQFPGKLRKDTKQVRLTADPSEGEDAPSRVAETARLPKKSGRPALNIRAGKAKESVDSQPLPEPAEKKADKKAIDNPAIAPYIDINETLLQCSPQEKAIVLALKDGEKLVDNVIADTGLGAREVLSSLTMLELRGIIERLPGRRVALRQK